MTDSTTTVAAASPVNATVFGQPIPILFGSAQILAAPLWASTPIENADGSRIIDIAYMLGYRDPLTTDVKLLKIFLNSSVAYSSEDATDTTGAATAGNLSTFKFTFYPGDPDQLPDPTIVAAEGAENTPAFTYRMYLVIQALYVPAGVTFPEITCEVSQTINVDNTRYVTPIPQANGPFVANNGNMFVDVAQGFLWAMDYGASPQVCRVFNINAQIEVYKFSIDALTILASGRYTPYLFGKDGTGHLAAIDLYANVVSAPTNSEYNGGIEFVKASAPLKDGTQFVYSHELGEAGVTYRFNPGAFTLVRHKKGGIGGPFGQYGIVPQPLAMNILSGNNDCGLCYFGAARDISIAFDTMSGESVVGTRTCVWPVNSTLYPGGRQQIDTLTASDVVQGVLNMDVFFRDTNSEPNWNTYYIKVMLPDPIAGKWIAALFVNGIDGTMYWCKFSTVYTGLGVIDCGNNPAPPLPAVTDIALLTFTKISNLNISLQNSADTLYAISQVPDNETVVSWTEGNGVGIVVSFDMSTGLYKTYLHGTFENTLTGFNYGADPAYDMLMVWNSAKRGFYYRHMGGTIPNPGFCFLTAAPKNGANLFISNLLLSICLLAGFSADQIVTTNCDNPIVGAIVNQATNYLDLLTSICSLWCIDIVESAGLIKFTRRLTGANFNVDKVLTDDDLAPVNQGGTDDGTIIQKLRNATVQLPSQIQTTYLDSDNDFQLGSQNARRTIYPVKTIYTANLNIQQIGVPVAMDAKTALYWTELSLFTQWSQALQLIFRVSQAHMDLEPGDYLQLNTLNDGNYTCKISEVDLNTDMSLSITAYTVLAIPPDNQNINPINVITGKQNELPFASQDGKFTYWVLDNFSITTAVGNEAVAQLQCYASVPLTVYLANLDGTYSKAVINAAAVSGVLGAAMPAIQTYQIGVPDLTTQLIVRSPTGVPVAAGNIAVGSVGRWEMMAYKSCVANSDGSYTLSNLLRGLRGTDTVNARLAGDAVLFLNQSSGATIAYTEVDGRSAQLIGTYSNRTPLDPIGKSSFVTLSGGSVKELAPMNVAAARVSNGINITWNRRSRIGGTVAFADGSANDPPLDQLLERYDVDIIGPAGTVIRTYAAVTQASVIYSTTDQNTDTYTVGNQLRVIVYQTSPFAGRGYGRDALCQVN